LGNREPHDYCVFSYMFCETRFTVRTRKFFYIKALVILLLDIFLVLNRQCSIWPLFHVSVSVLVSAHPDKSRSSWITLGYSCRPYQYPDSLIRKQRPYKMAQWAILSGCRRHTDIIWQNQGIKTILTGRFSALLPNCFTLLLNKNELYYYIDYYLCLIADIAIIFS